MTSNAPAGEHLDDATRLRHALADTLIADGWITDPAVEAAFRAVPRHLFTPPGTARAGFPPPSPATGRSPTTSPARPPDGEFEFGACAYGLRAADAAGAFLAAVNGWTRHGRDLPKDAFAYWPAGTTPLPPAGPGPAGIFPKHNGTLTIQWPPERAAAHPSNDMPAE